MALILDTGPLYASLDRSDADHDACRALIESSGEPLVIPSPVLVEVDYWIHQRLQPGALVALLGDIEDGRTQWRTSVLSTTGESERSVIDTPMLISALLMRQSWPWPSVSTSPS